MSADAGSHNVALLDRRLVYGARCSWWDTIDKIGKRDGLPCCPHCGSVLFEMPNEQPWWAGVDRVESEGNPGYRDFVTWARGRCFPNYKAALVAYAAANPGATLPTV